MVLMTVAQAEMGLPRRCASAPPAPAGSRPAHHAWDRSHGRALACRTHHEPNL